MEISYKVGNVIESVLENDTNKLLIHVCNNVNKWGQGFTLSLSKKWKSPEKMFRGKKINILGETDFVRVSNNITVANMVAQFGLKSKVNRRPIDYNALRYCLRKVAAYAKKYKCSVYMPKIGVGLGGGHWDTIEKIIKKELDGLNIFVFEYVHKKLEDEQEQKLENNQDDRPEDLEWAKIMKDEQEVEQEEQKEK